MCFLLGTRLNNTSQNTLKMEFEPGKPGISNVEIFGNHFLEY